MGGKLTWIWLTLTHLMLLGSSKMLAGDGSSGTWVLLERRGRGILCGRVSVGRRGQPRDKHGLGSFQR